MFRVALRSVGNRVCRKLGAVRAAGISRGASGNIRPLLASCAAASAFAVSKNLLEQPRCEEQNPDDLPPSLVDLIGSTEHLLCTSGRMQIRGLEVAWWRYEDPDSSLGHPPVVAVHGGPGFPHNYILPLKKLASMGHPVVFYDQCGCGASSFVEKPVEDAPWLLTISYYVEELSQLVAHLGLEQEGFYVYGSSWGTILAQEFAVTQPRALRGLILDGALCDASVYIKTQWRDRISTLPSFTQKTLRRLEDSKDYCSSTYQQLESVLTSHFTTRLVPTPQCFIDCIAKVNKEVYVGMQGASEFTIGGVLEEWSITERLSAIRVPTLVLMGEFDTMTTECSQLVVDSIPTAWPLVTIPRAAHCKLIDEPLLCCEATRKFLVTTEEIRRAAVTELRE